MAENTGQLDKLIENKVDETIKDFAKDIENQISKFLTSNGHYSGEYLEQVKSWYMGRNGNAQINELANEKITRVSKSLVAGLNKTIKPKMIERATKELLSKIDLLS